MPRKFPRTREDGTFCVVAKFTTTQNAANLRDQVNEWCKQWVDENKEWHRVWMSGEPLVVTEEIDLDYSDSFTGSPSVIKAEDTQLWLRFDAPYGSYWWRDWLVRIASGLQKVFPELKPDDNRISFDCDE